MEIFRKLSCDSPNTVGNVPNSSAKPEKAMTKPLTMNSGRHRPCWPIDVPSRIGSSGRMQGAAAVSNPAANASAISIIAVILVGSRRRHFFSVRTGLPFSTM